ncbi:unnamed protein product [Chrysodeixis includens]|uniref:FLYWCH-type domain-containing protein n=1 Tax=Chrysodeixis includens TaxID=689277 RepID=A0A9N8KV76_CHRIL|nr:unnamed protein product [Chrysodeixis includens]
MWCVWRKTGGHTCTVTAIGTERTTAQAARCGGSAARGMPCPAQVRDTVLQSCGESVSLCYHGYRYTKAETRGGRVWWVCSRRRSLRCPATLVTFDGQPIVVTVKKHTHKNY